MLVAVVASLLLMTEPPPAGSMPAAELKWEAHLAKHPTDPKVMFSLMSVGGFLARTSSAHEQLIREWLAAHPKAVVVRVADLGPWRTDDPDAHMYYVWLVDGSSNLNLHLVETGDCAGSTMEVPANDPLLVPEAQYKEFIEKAVAAHRAAREKKLGIWAQSSEE